MPKCHACRNGCDRCKFRGPTGSEGPTGPSGSEGPTGPSGSVAKHSASYVFATSESVGRNDYIGSGNSSAIYLRNTIVVCGDSIASSLVFSIREFSSALPYTATLWINGVASIFSVTIPDGSVSTSAVASGNVQLNVGDIISIQITYPPNGALSSGACATLCVS